VVREIEAKSILRKQKKIDSWFISRYGMNLYRGCGHNCAYCDGRWEGYYVEGEFGHEVEVKINAPEVLERELDPSRKRKPFEKGFFVFGGGVSDSYQPLEKRYGISRVALTLLDRFRHPVHILTKSTLVERDLDLLQDIHRNSRAMISFSLSSVDDEVSRLVEPGVPSPSLRLALMKKAKDLNLPAGIFLMPVLPGLTDTQEKIDDSVQRIKDMGGDYIIFGGLTLKEGRQKDHYYALLKEHYPDLPGKYDRIYRGNKWGQAVEKYYQRISDRFLSSSLKFDIPVRIPLPFYSDLLGETERIIVILEHLEYLLKLRGERTGFGKAAYTLSRKRDGGGPSLPFDARTASIIGEIRETGTCSLYTSLI
jgi:DNA repair photolyase